MQVIGDCVSLTFETLGNATIQFAVGGKPLFVTDPWLTGTCYFGSWALDHPLSEAQIRNIQTSEYIWISHGHPDHLHHESLELIPRTAKFLVPDHYDRDIFNFLTGMGFTVEILPYRTWHRLHPDLEVLCIDNENQDSILVARFGNALVIDLNDSPFFGEEQFLRRLVRQHPNDRVFVAQLCSVDADMRNFVDASGTRLLDPPEMLKPGAITAVARGAHRLGAKFFCCSSSQHIYVRADTVWANPYRITYPEMRRYWNRPEVELVPPFVTVDLMTGTYTENHPSQLSDTSQITARTGDDDWDETLSAEEWRSVEAFFRKFKLLGRHIDFVEVAVGSERRRFEMKPSRAGGTPSGITFSVPRRSLLDTVAYGYFDDLLIGNFMKTELHGRAQLYPFITPIIAKIGGNAKVFDQLQYLRFCLRYFRRNPLGFSSWRVRRWIDYSFLPWTREWADRLGVFAPLKIVYRKWLLKDYPLPDEAAPQCQQSKPRAAWAPAVTRQGKWALPRPDLSLYDRPRLIISIDTEEDFDWTQPLSPESKAVHSMSRQHLAQDLIERHGAKPIYLCDFPIADQEPAYRVLHEWYAAGRCDIGTQLHPWVNPPHVETVNNINSYPCNLPLELQREKLRILTDKITENIGARPTVYKAGRYGADGNVATLLKPLGYSIDMSINPIRNYTAYGGPNHIRFPHTPFWLDAEREILAIPCTCNVLGLLREHWVELSGPVWSNTGDRFKLSSIMRRLGLMNRVVLTPEGMPLEEAKALTRFLVAAGHRVFSLIYHSPSLTPGSTPYVRNEADVSKFLGWVDAYLEFFFGELNGLPATPLDIYGDARLAPVTLAPLP